MIEELKEYEELYTRELISLPSTASTLGIRYLNGKVYMIQFQTKDQDSKVSGFTIQDGSDCPIEIFLILMKEYFKEKLKENKNNGTE